MPGCPGAPTITAADGADATLVPFAFVAVTVHRYARFVVTAATTIGAAVAPLCTPLLVAPPLLETHLAVNFVIAAPLARPATKRTVNDPVASLVEPDAAFAADGVEGAVATTNAFDAEDSAPGPTMFDAFTLQV